METLSGAVKLMLFTYGLAAVVAFGTAAIIRLIHAAIRRRRRNGDAAGDPGKAPASAERAEPAKEA